MFFSPLKTWERARLTHRVSKEGDYPNQARDPRAPRDFHRYEAERNVATTTRRARMIWRMPAWQTRIRRLPHHP
jgi:hypothetical protein